MYVRVRTYVDVCMYEQFGLLNLEHCARFWYFGTGINTVVVLMKRTSWWRAVDSMLCI